MGGDHKCPVCDATFTRPQHVARHMRSHTGDRPYKCQFCGDQFARSDLLARHVNKCHANEKPLLPPPGARRKGSASTSRATTSKQACDQCVQNTLPCDGANPCAKCTQRKIRCTFVKFHRQTAPVGPGHNNPQGEVFSQSTPSFSTRTESFSGPRDDLHLGSASLTMADNLFADGFVFSPVYSDSAHTESASMVEPTDFSSRYRARADILRTDEQIALAQAFTDIRTGWAGPVGAHGGPGSTWDHPRLNQEKAHRHQQQPHQYPPSATSTLYRHSTRRLKPGFEMDLDSSDGSASSIPSSSAGSEVHLPLPPASVQVRGAFSSSDPTFSQQTLADPTAAPFLPQASFHPSSSFPGATTIVHPTPAPAPPQETFDESTFGALSLDDPSLLTTEAPPFFSDILTVNSSTSGTGILDPNATPMPPRSSNSAEVDGDLWRAFMRSTPVGEQPHHPHQARRASVPAVTGNPYPTYTTAARPGSSQPPFHQPLYAQPQTQHPQPDDLARYQQAILARARETETVLRPPPDARPKPRRKTVDVAGGQYLSVSRPVLMSGIHGAGSRPHSAGSSTSSGSSSSSMVGSFGVGAGVEVEVEGLQLRPGMKRELSNEIQVEPGSKRRVVGQEVGATAG